VTKHRLGAVERDLATSWRKNPSEISSDFGS
jgi:hypothetical protein